MLFNYKQPFSIHKDKEKVRIHSKNNFIKIDIWRIMKFNIEGANLKGLNYRSHY